ncbi:MAG: helicase-exonuclease AddAB subunit AddB, partial [Bacillota bacterium]|nr:helicase-exonuclease AddAB subunit AddB [Bacillota bacterium]
MGLRFVIGRAGTGKTYYCLNEISSQLKDRPQGDPLIYLVPEQMTFQSEYLLSTTPGLNGIIRAQVFSFSRLAWRVLQEAGGMSRYHLNSVGMNMLLRRIIEKHRQSLKMFNWASEQLDFTEQLEEIIIELKRYCIEPAKLKAKLADFSGKLEGAGQQVFLDKLQDLALIYQELEEELANKYFYADDYLSLLVDKVSSAPEIKNAEIWIDGFHYFSPQELQVIEALALYCKRVTIVLTLDKP